MEKEDKELAEYLKETLLKEADELLKDPEKSAELYRMFQRESMLERRGWQNMGRNPVIPIARLIHRERLLTQEVRLRMSPMILAVLKRCEQKYKISKDEIIDRILLLFFRMV